MELPSKDDLNSFLKERTDQFNKYCYTILQPQFIRTISTEGQNVIDVKQREIAGINSKMVEYNDRLTHILHTVEREHAALSQNVKETKLRTGDIRGQLVKKREITDLRKEQADELKTKYGADIHTSVLGLWRPLHPETHAILYTVSILLGLLSVAAIGFLILTRSTLPAIAKPATFAPTSLFEGGSFRGGWMKHFQKK